MTAVEEEISINVSIEAVYEYVATPENHTVMNPSIVEITNVDELANGGYEGDFTFQILGRRISGHFRDVERDPPNRLEYEIEGPLDAFVTYDFTRENSVTQFTYTNEFEPPGSELIEGLAASLIKPYLELNTKFMLENIKMILESK